MELHYEQMKAGSLITAACVGYITSAKSSQLVLCKQLTVEVWDLKDNNLRQAATIELSLPVIDCVVLQCPQVFTELLPGSNQKEHPSHNGFGHLDSLLVVNNHGTIMILRWDATAGKLTKCPPSEISEDSWINLSMMITETNISKPFFMPSNVSIKRSYAQDMQLGVSIVAVCSFENIIQLVCVSWEMRHQIDDSCTCSSSASKIKELSRITHNLKIHFLKVPNEIALISDVTPSQRTLSILGLCFMGDNTSDCRSLNASALDFKGRPLLVILSASKGLCQNILSLDCFAADLNDKQLGYGPWKMRNLHPTTNLLIPWKYYDTPEGEIIEDRRGANVPLKIGVLLVSSVAITLIKADGKRCSSMVSLKGIPACCDVCNNFRMVIADTCSTMYILDGGDWSNIKMQIILFDYPLSVPQVVHCFNYGGISGSETVSIFVCGEGGDIHIFGLLGKTIAKAGQSSCTIESENFVTAETLWSSMVYDTFGGNNVGKKEKLQDHDFQLSGATPVHDSLLLCDDDCSSNCQLLLACGNSPNGTLCRVTLAFQSVVDEVYDVQIHSLPKILTFTLNMNHPNKVHIVLSYEVQDASELLEWTETGLASCFMEGFDADHQTLAIEMIHSKLIVQVTSKSVRLFEGEGLFISEWLPSTVFQGSTDKRLSDKPSRISAAAMNSKGIALAAMRNLYTLDVDVNGCFRVLGSRFHQYEVSTIGVCLLQESIPRNDETCHFGGLDLVIVGEWVSNMACLLTWPDMKGIVRVDCGSLGSMRSIAIADVGGLQYLFLGSTAGDLYFLNLIVQYVRNEEIGKGNADYFTSEEDEGLEILAAAKTERDYFMIVDNMQRNLKVTVMGRSSFKVGSSEVFVRTGRFFGSKSPQVRTVSSSPSAFIYAYTSENSAVAFRENKTLGAYTVHGTGYSAISTTSFHSERFPYSLISVCRNGNLIISHLDTSPKLCWDTVHLDGKPSLLAYHKGNDSAIVSCQGHNSAWLSFFQVRNLKHVLTVPLGEDCRNTLLGVMEFSYSPSVGRVPECCLIIGSNNYNNPVGSLSFIGYQSFNPGERKMQYEAHLIAKHDTETPFFCFCILLGGANQWLFTDHEDKLMSRLPLQHTKMDTAPVLAVGGFGKVILYCISFKQEQTHPCNREMYPRKILEFPSLGRSYVTALAPTCENTLLVLEELFGVSIFLLHANLIAVPLSVHHFHNPIQAVCLLSSTELVMAVHSEGIKLMMRNVDEELAYQIERLSMEDFNQKRRDEESGRHSVDARALIREEIEEKTISPMPVLQNSANISLPYTANTLISGKLGISIRSYPCMIDEVLPTDCKSVIVVTQFGEIGILKVVNGLSSLTHERIRCMRIKGDTANNLHGMVTETICKAWLMCTKLASFPLSFSATM